MEYRLTEFPDLGYEEDMGDATEIKIALITFAYDNAKIINELTSRGVAIKNEDYRSLDHINRHVVEHLAHDQVMLD